MVIINRNRLIDILTDYFLINKPQGSDAYFLRHSLDLAKEKPEILCRGVTIDNFREFDREAIEDMADYIVAEFED